MARHIKINGGALSQILSGKRIPSLKTAQKIVRSLGLSPDEESLFLYSLAQTQRSRGLRRINPYLRSLDRPEQPKPLNVDLFQVLANWYCIAILELTFVADFKADTSWVAERLGITATQAQVAIDRLLSLELLERRGETLVKRDGPLATADRELTTSALLRLQRQLIEKSLHSMDTDPIETRSNTSMIMAIDPALMPLAKQQIEVFAQELCAFLENGKRRQVYNLNINLNPMTEGVSR